MQLHESAPADMLLRVLSATNETRRKALLLAANKVLSLNLFICLRLANASCGFVPSVLPIPVHLLSTLVTSAHDEHDHGYFH